MRLRSLVAMIASVILTLAGIACKRETPQPTISTIPLKLWVVLNNQPSDVFDQGGSDDNQGCRLSLANITSYIEALQNNRHIFGANFEFTWDGTAEVVRSQFIPLDFGIGATERRTNAGQAMMDLILAQGKWQPNAINLYFSGWMTPAPTTMLMPNGLTIDPSQMGPSNAHIIINDRGWNSDSGSQVVLSEHAFEHEMAHFLLRRGGIPPYDGGEHVPDGSQNILDEFAEHPLVLPTAEQQETRDRIQNGTWDNP